MTPTTNILRTDEEIKATVVDELRWDTRVDAAKIAVLVEGGFVTLKGTVPTYGASVAAETDAWDVLGVLGVDNQLTVELASVPPIPNDATIRSNAERTLEWNPDIDSLNIRVAVNEGLVTLTGTVPTHWEKIEAEELVRILRGVISVKNELAVVPTMDISDEIIAEDVVDALERSTLVAADKVDVTVNRGTVTLSGSVPTAAARIAAYRAANRTAGVVHVQNNLVLKP